MGRTLTFPARTYTQQTHKPFHSSQLYAGSVWATVGKNLRLTADYLELYAASALKTRSTSAYRPDDSPIAVAQMHRVE